jgi:uncharacterized membrane protein
MTKRLINYVGWGIILSVSLYFIYNNAFRYFSYDADTYGKNGWPYAPWILIHVVTAMSAFLLGPTQFISGLRRKYPRTHRTLGKIYLGSVLVAAITSLHLSIGKEIMTENLLANGTGLAALAFVWLLTSGMAYWAVRSRNFEQHREWMIRSFTVTCAFASIRLANKILTEQFHVDGQVADDFLAWAGWALPLIVVEAFLQGSKIRKANSLA